MSYVTLSKLLAPHCFTLGDTVLQSKRMSNRLRRCECTLAGIL